MQAAARPLVAVACSGGRDSLALLHVTARLARQFGVEVLALHVHHGLMPAADDWQASVEAHCRQWAEQGLPVRCLVDRAQGGPARGESIEAWARAQRHAALAAMARREGASLLLLAHHRRDQAETVVLQALRGAGAAGLAAMPQRRARDGLVWARPWLMQPREAIDAYVQQHGLTPVEDDSNADPRFARNRLRAQVWPALRKAFPAAERALATAALRAAEADACLADLAALDLPLLVDGAALRLDAWAALPAHRRANVLRHWLAAQGVTPRASLIERVTHEAVAGEAPARWPLSFGELRRYRGHLRFAGRPGVEAREAARREQWVSIDDAGEIALPGWGGRLVASSVEQGGAPRAALTRLTLCPRAGGERFQMGPHQPPRSLKKQYQALGVEPRERGGPLLYAGDQILFVPGLGIDARCVAPRGAPQLTLRWVADEG